MLVLSSSSEIGGMMLMCSGWLAEHCCTVLGGCLLAQVKRARLQVSDILVPRYNSSPSFNASLRIIFSKRFIIFQVEIIGLIPWNNTLLSELHYFRGIIHISSTISAV